MSATIPEVDVEGELQAWTRTDAGSVIRLRGYEVDGEWFEAAEVVCPEGHVTTLCDGQGMEPTKVYNHTIIPHLDDQSEPAPTPVDGEEA